MLLNEDDVRKVLRMEDLIPAMADALRELSTGAILQPLRTVLPVSEHEGFLGVMPEYQHTGVAAALYVEHFDTAVRVRQKWGEMGWILETNHNMNRAMEAMGGRIVKRYRVYGRDL